MPRSRFIYDDDNTNSRKMQQIFQNDLTRGRICDKIKTESSTTGRIQKGGMKFMGNLAKICGLLSGALVVGAGASLYGANKLFQTVIPRQDQLRVDVSEMADPKKWEEYKKVISVRKEWLLSQNLEEIEITARDGIKLHAYYLPAEKPSHRLVIGLHGYTSCATSDFAAHSYFFHQLGFDCLLPDHRAHGKSGGEYIGFGILDRFDCRAWIDYLNERFPEKKQILLHGTSMGSTTALMTIGDPTLPENVKGVIADCGFTSPYDVFKHVLRKSYHLPPHPIMDINDSMCRCKAGYGFRDYSTLTAVQHTRCPILFIHGAEDKFVPTWMTRKNYDVCVSPKEMLIVPKAGHGASYYENPELYEDTERKWIQKWIPEISGDDVEKEND